MLRDVKSVLVGVTEEGKDERSAALGYGLSLALAADAHLTVQAASHKLILNHAFVSRFAAGLVSAENKRLGALAGAVAERARMEAASSGVSCSVETPHLSYNDLVSAFLKQGRLHDLSVLDGEEASFDLDRGLIEAALFESGRPLIVVPTGHDTFKARQVIVAWDGSPHAARAVAHAMPFLRMAEAVELVSVVGEKDLSNSAKASDLAPHLARHAVNVTVNELPVASDGKVETTLRSEIERLGADLLVMGAFKRSRLRELILGGVTHSLLGRTPAPLFMSH